MKAIPFESFRIHTGGGVLMIKHVIERDDLSLLVASDGKFQIGIADLVDILDPASVTLDGVSRQTNEFDASFRELQARWCRQGFRPQGGRTGPPSCFQCTITP